MDRRFATLELLPQLGNFIPELADFVGWFGLLSGASFEQHWSHADQHHDSAAKQRK